MFTPNSQCLLSRFAGRDRHAQEIYGEPEVIGYSPVRLLAQTEKTSVRSDSSASRGQAEVTQGVFKILVDKVVARPRADDRIDLDGVTFRILNVHPRYRVFGGFDHWEIDLEPLG